MELGLEFSQVSLIPQYSDLVSRAEVSLETELAFNSLLDTGQLGYFIRIPILSAAMDTVTGLAMQKAMAEHGTLGIHHRYCSEVRIWQASQGGAIAIAPSMSRNLLSSLDAQTIVVIDVAHGDNKKSLELAEYCVKRNLSVVSGNIVTAEAARRYWEAGVRCFRVGIGGGSVCSTRTVAGVGVPQWTAIRDIREAFPDCGIISDGGCKSSGDIVKALAIGADAVILGRLLADTEEALGERKVMALKMHKEFRGMASRSALEDAGKEVNVEGVSTWLPIGGTVKERLKELASGMRAGFAYLGAKNITELRQKAQWVRVS